MPARVLKEDWSEYDNKKKKGVDARFFACTEAWEVNYLVKMVRKVYPLYTEASVRAAIMQCCKELKAPHPRERFVTCVVHRLRTNKP